MPVLDFTFLSFVSENKLLDEQNKAVAVQFSSDKPSETSMGCRVGLSSCPLCAEDKVPEGTKVPGCVLCDENKPHIHNFF